MNHILRSATAADLPQAARTLALAFDRYPWTRWSIPADRYEARLEELQTLYLKHALCHGLVLIDEEVRGVGAFLPPDTPEPGGDTQARIAELLGNRLEILMGLQLPSLPSDAWNLATLGVHPGSAGKGLGSAIISEGLRQIDGIGPVGLETSDERNVQLYERHGFTITATTHIPGGPSVYSMRRDLTTKDGR
ncbi:GNAT family N-acetyltransferase [Arthrobacter sp. G119Y2]|uniref:GNAT family N-acetyltransferase n=1 Tax=Arthrobacter sp. G119Y2 TaxID=3134965 RepID=UPI00311964F3